MPNTTAQTLKAAKFTKDHLTDIEIKQLTEAVKVASRYAHRDALMIMLAYRHGFRSLELVNLKWHQINFDRGYIEVHRVKNGDPSKQPLSGDEIRALRQLKRENTESPFIFCTERGGPMTTRTYRNMVQQAGKRAGFDFPVHTHMLRHSTGYALVNKGIDTRAIQGYLGHRNIQSTVRYTKLNENRFNGFEKLF